MVQMETISSTIAGTIANGESRLEIGQQVATTRKRIVIVGLGMVAISFMHVSHPRVRLLANLLTYKVRKLSNSMLSNDNMT